MVSPEYMKSLCRDYGLWLRAGKTWPCSGIGYPQGCQYGTEKPATSKQKARSQALYAEIKKIDKHHVLELFAPIQATTSGRKGKSREPGHLRADRLVEQLDTIIKAMPWPQRLVLMHTYAHPGSKELTTREVAPLIGASKTMVSKELNTAINFLVDRWNSRALDKNHLREIASG